MADRPKTQREILKAKAEAEARSLKKVVVHNTSGQMIRLRLRAPLSPKTGKRLDFYRAEGGAEIGPGKHATIVEDRLDTNQISNLCKRGYIRIKSVNG